MKACRHCRLITYDKKKERCDHCNSTDLSGDYSGMVVITNPEKSEIAKKLNINKKGHYALKVR